MAESKRPTRQSEEWQERDEEEKILGRSHLGSEVPFGLPKIHLLWFWANQRDAKWGRPTCLLFALSYWLQGLRPPAAKKVHFFFALPSTFLVKLGGFHIFLLTDVSPRSPLRADYFGTRIGPVRWPHHASRRNADACILHACDVSFTIANYNVMGTSGATDKCTNMLNSRWGSRRYMGL